MPVQSPPSPRAGRSRACAASLLRSGSRGPDLSCVCMAQNAESGRRSTWLAARTRCKLRRMPAVELRMPIKPPPPVALYGDLERARQIARSWKCLDHLGEADIEMVARAIAEGIAEGRRHGLGIARTYPEWSRNDGAVGQKQPVATA